MKFLGLFSLNLAKPMLEHGESEGRSSVLLPWEGIQQGLGLFYLPRDF